MSGPSVLEVSGVGKSYKKGGGIGTRIGAWFGFASSVQATWVLEDLTFSIVRGEALGIVGDNGAGKSTLLKLLAGVSQPSAGTIVRHAPVRSVIELGLGFNPEFTGRSNARIACAALGLDAGRTAELIPVIESFSELGDYFDQPLRTYSSGMQARLAFSVVTADRPELLILDEVLSVGDAYFQHKSFARIREMKALGTAIILVSHGLESVRTLCDRVLLLEKGKLLRDGPPDEVIDLYNALTAGRQSGQQTPEQRRLKDGWVETRSGSGEARIRSLSLSDAETQLPVAVARVGQKLVLNAEIEVFADLPRLVVGFQLRDRMGQLIWGSNTAYTKQEMDGLRAGDKVHCKLPFTCSLGVGSYSFSPALVSTESHLVNNYEWTDNALVFEVLNVQFPTFIGSSHLDATFQLTADGAARTR